MNWILSSALAALVAAAEPAVAAEATRGRPLNEADQRTVMSALLAQATAPTASDPSCKADLSDSQPVSTVRALGDVLARGAADKRAVRVRIDCFTRRDYPLAPGEEYCRVGLVPSDRPGDFGYGVLFRMNWREKSVAAASVECY